MRSISLFAQTRMTRKREAKQELPHSALRAGQARNPPFLSILWFPLFHVPQVDPVRIKTPSATTSRGERGTKRFRKVGIVSDRDIDLSAQQTLRISTFSPCFHFFHWNQFHSSLSQSKEGNATLIDRKKPPWQQEGHNRSKSAKHTSQGAKRKWKRQVILFYLWEL